MSKSLTSPCLSGWNSTADIIATDALSRARAARKNWLRKACSDGRDEQAAANSARGASASTTANPARTLLVVMGSPASEKLLLLPLAPQGQWTRRCRRHPNPSRARLEWRGQLFGWRWRASEESCLAA